MIVIADDITGAAEIAGIAWAHGRSVSLVCGRPSAEAVSAARVAGTVTVVATDTRSMTTAEAVAETRRVAEPLGTCRLFKKTDSALRGHVVEELAALMAVTGRSRAVFLPANPSKGRTIRGGAYYVNGTPLHQTDFRFDPEFPARTSVLAERFPDAAAHGILMPDAVTLTDVGCVAHAYADGLVLLAGAADFFTAVLGDAATPSHVPAEGRPVPAQRMASLSPQQGAMADFPSTLILCGSTQSKALDLGIPMAPMPAAIYDGGTDLTCWDTHLYDTHGSLVLTIPHRHRTGRDVAVHLRTVMADMARRLVSSHRPAHLIIEGGATAWAVLGVLGWTQFRVVRQFAPGVVQMRAANGVLVTLKPGSYPWGGLFGGSADAPSATSVNG